MKREKPITAEELLKRLEDDPAHRARQEALRKELQELSAIERELVFDLKANGVTVASVWDLVNTNESYANAIPVLIEHLE